VGRIDEGFQRHIERLELAGFDVDDAVLILEFAGDEQETRAGDDDAVRLENIGGDDDVGDSGFVFKREEDEAFGGAGALAADYSACGADWLLGACGFEFGGREDAEAAEALALIGHGVRAGGNASSGVVGGEALVGGHFAEGVCNRAGGCGAAQEWADWAACLLDLPEGIAAVLYVAEGVERADLSEGDEFLAIERGDTGGEFVDGAEGAVEIAGAESIPQGLKPRSFCWTQRHD
jgi:hypothetical protein